MVNFFELKDSICLQQHPAWSDMGNPLFGDVLKIHFGISVCYIMHNAF
jgi:hypothetical protein